MFLKHFRTKKIDPKTEAKIKACTICGSLFLESYAYVSKKSINHLTAYVKCIGYCEYIVNCRWEKCRKFKRVLYLSGFSKRSILMPKYKKEVKNGEQEYK